MKSIKIKKRGLRYANTRIRRNVSGNDTVIKTKSTNVHSVDVVEELNYAKSSVSRGMNLLVKNGYITMDRVTGVIEFTEKGREKAQNIYERHRVLTKALEKIGASAEMAEENACRIEHVISEDMFEIIKKFVNEG